MRRARSRGALLASLVALASSAALASLAGCGGAETGLVVAVGSDLAIPTDLALLRAQVWSADSGALVSQNDFVLSAPAELPLSFVVVPRDPAAAGVITVVLEAYDPARERRLEHRASVAFARDRRPVLPVFLATACGAMSCASGETCDRGACRSQVVDASALADVEPGQELAGVGP